MRQFMDVWTLEEWKAAMKGLDSPKSNGHAAHT